MTAVLFFPECFVFIGKQDGFWVQCPAVELEEKIIPYLKEEDLESFNQGRLHYNSTEWVNINPNLIVKSDSYYFLVSRNGQEVIPTDPFYPYASQWDGYMYLQKMKQIKIDSIFELPSIKVELK